MSRACSRHETYHSNHVDVETATAEILLKTWVGVVRARLRDDLDGILEVTNVTLIAGFLEQIPCLILGLVSDAGVVNHFRIGAIQSDVT